MYLCHQGKARLRITKLKANAVMNHKLYCVVFAGGMFPAALKLEVEHVSTIALRKVKWCTDKIGTLTYLRRLLGYLRYNRYTATVTTGCYTTVSSIPSPGCSVATYTDKEEVHDRVVRLPGLEHALGSNTSPNDRCVVYNSSSIASAFAK